jgi:site-specific DNA recombinase
MADTFSANGRRAVIYARVSTTAQLDNTSPESQIRRCQDYCQKKGYTIVTKETEAIGGSFVLSRSKFNRLLDMAADGQINTIVADIPDRLGRGEAIGQLRLLAKMSGAVIEFAAPGRDTNTVEGMALDLTDQLVSGIERQNIRRRMMGGRRDRAREGRVIASPKSVYGYSTVREFDDRGRKVGCRLVIQEDEARVVEQIFQMCAYDGLSCYAITRQLEDLGISAPKGGKRWGRGSVRGILKNPTYTGTWYYAKNDVERHDTADGIKRTTRTRDKSEWIPVTVPAIVATELYNAAQDKMTQQKAWGHKPTAHLYLLRGRIRCFRCHSLLVGCGESTTRKDGTPYDTHYKCRKGYADFAGPHHCEAKRINGPLVEAAAWDIIREMLLDRTRLLEGIEAERAEEEKAHRIIHAALADLDAKDEKAQSKIDRWLDLYGDEGMTKKQYEAKCKDVESEIKKRGKEREKLQKQLAERKALTVDQQQELENYIADTTTGIDGATFDDKLKYLEWLKVECLYDDTTTDLTVMGILGTRTRTLRTAS